jgi:hypothetical protein
MEIHVLALLIGVTVADTGPAEAGHYDHNIASSVRLQADREHIGNSVHLQADRGVQTPALTDARAIALGAPQALVEIDTGKLKGDPAMLAWSPDRTELYLQTVERDRRGAVASTKHYVIPLASKSLKKVDQPPAWAGAYWAWKADRSAPGAPAFKIDIDEREETRRATAAVGDLAKGGGGSIDGLGIAGTTAEEAANIANQSQVVHIWRLKVRGETIGEWPNQAVVPGISYGWAPAPNRLIAFAKPGGGPIFVLDDQGRKQELPGTKDASLPAWSNDAGQLAWLSRKDRRKFDVMFAAVTAR